MGLDWNPPFRTLFVQSGEEIEWLSQRPNQTTHVRVFLRSGVGPFPFLGLTLRWDNLRILSSVTYP